MLCPQCDSHTHWFERKGEISLFQEEEEEEEKEEEEEEEKEEEEEGVI